MRKIFPEIVEELMKKNKSVFCLLGDIGVHSFRKVFKNYSQRILNMSTLEQSMIGFAAGLSKAGYVPIVHSITPFLILRALEQIKVDFVYNKLNCNIVSVGASNDYAKLGTTHQCYEDINILSNYEDVNLFIPANKEEFKFLFKKHFNNNSVNYFRISDFANKKVTKTNSFVKLENHKNLLIIVGNGLDSSNLKLKKCDIYYINSIQRSLNFHFIKNYKKIAIIEPYYGNVIETKIRNKKLLKNTILTINYKETIVHKYGDKILQDKFLKFDKLSILKKINEFF